MIWDERIFDSYVIFLEINIQLLLRVNGLNIGEVLTNLYLGKIASPLPGFRTSTPASLIPALTVMLLESSSSETYMFWCVGSPSKAFH